MIDTLIRHTSGQFAPHVLSVMQFQKFYRERLPSPAEPHTLEDLMVAGEEYIE